MARLRYVRAPAPPAAGPGTAGAAGAAAPPPVRIRHTVRSIRALYLTEPEIAAAVLPRPLTPAAEPRVFVQLAQVTMHLASDRVVTIGAATVGVACHGEGRAGYYVLAMPMEGEAVVIGGREKYGEPKKLATTRFDFGPAMGSEAGAPDAGGARVSAGVTRHGVTFLEVEGTLGGPSPEPLAFTEHFFCFKALPACQPENSANGGFDGEVLLTLLTWERAYTSRRVLTEGRITLRESPHDPLIDVPVKRLLSLELCEGASRTGGEVLRTVPGEWLAPFLVQRYDDPQPGIEVRLASEQAGGGVPSGEAERGNDA